MPDFSRRHRTARHRTSFLELRAPSAGSAGPACVRARPWTGRAVLSGGGRRARNARPTGRLGLVSFCKTTGGKGLHVLTPLAVNKRKPLTWAAAKGFANDVCQEWPATIQTSISSRCQEPEGRADFPRLSSQRSHGDAVAPLSPRARPGAIVCGSPGRRSNPTSIRSASPSAR